MSLIPEKDLENASREQIKGALQTVLNAPEHSLDLLVDSVCSADGVPFTSYSGLLAKAFEVVKHWSVEKQEAFVHGHPRIGAVENLSGLSLEEQAAHGASPETVLKLGELNEKYETSLPTLRYITFVNGRTRAELIPEFEEVIADIEKGIRTHDTERVRALEDIWKIAQARTAKLLNAA